MATGIPVQFISLTQAEYDGLPTKQEGKLYFTNDTNRLYKGTELYGIGGIEDLNRVNYPLDNPIESSETVDSVTYKRFDINDHTIATISLSDATPVRIHFPDKPTENFCRDFIVKIKVTSNDIPQVQFVKGQNDTSIGFEYEDDSWVILEVGINYFTFTETERE